MKYLFLCVLTVTAMTAITQTDLSLEDNGVYLSDSDFLSCHLKDGFNDQKGCRLNNNRKEYLIIQTEAVRDTFYFDSIWGFRKNGADWRIFKNEYYQIEFKNDKICLYDIPGSGQSEGIHETHYFSTTAGTPVYHLSKHNLMLVFRENQPFVEKIRGMGFARSVFKWDKKHHNYTFLNWLR